MSARLSIDRMVRTWRNHRADRALFDRLCVAHGLDAEDRELLIDLADHHGLVRMSQVFMRPSLFRGNVGTGRESTERLTKLRERLFVEPAQSAPSAADFMIADSAFTPSS
ncbi:MAG: hypothetical protein ACKVX7_11765 [Planctomycetota bacterium]